jgi:hypothetical protein
MVNNRVREGGITNLSNVCVQAGVSHYNSVGALAGCPSALPTSWKAEGQAVPLALAGGPWGPAARAAAADATMSPLSCMHRTMDGLSVSHGEEQSVGQGCHPDFPHVQK